MADVSPSDADGQAVPSVRLLQILRTYCSGLDPAGLADLQHSVTAGRYPWLRDELSAALRGPAPAGKWWQEAIGDTRDAVATTDPHSPQQRLWRALFPTDPYPHGGTPA